MAIKYGFFNSVDGDRKYDADDIGNYFLKLISDGVFATPATAMQVTAAGGLKVSVAAGWGFIKCKYLNNTSALQLTLSAADVVLNRYDRIVMRLDYTNRLMTIAVKQGTAASTPKVPALTRTSNVWELSLARVYVAAGATVINQSDITDERGNTTLCGYVTGLINQIDTTNLFAQYNNAFYSWFNDVKEEVTATTIISRFSSVYTTPSNDEVTTIPINISQYNANLDVLNVFINGFKAIAGVDYTVSGTNIVLTNALDVAGTKVEFECLKSVDGAEAASLTADVRALQDAIGDLKFMKLTQAQYDAIANPDENTVYIIVG